MTLAIGSDGGGVAAVKKVRVDFRLVRGRFEPTATRHPFTTTTCEAPTARLPLEQGPREGVLSVMMSAAYNEIVNMKAVSPCRKHASSVGKAHLLRPVGVGSRISLRLRAQERLPESNPPLLSELTFILVAADGERIPLTAQHLLEMLEKKELVLCNE
eukprot:5121631-Prymnesium_polylepis.1